MIRARYLERGDHVHCRVFVSKGKGMTFALCGELVFCKGVEWDSVRDALQAVVDFTPDKPPKAMLASHKCTVCGEPAHDCVGFRPDGSIRDPRCWAHLPSEVPRG